MADEEPIAMKGWLKKRGHRVKSLWGDRYFILRGSSLSYYLKQSDTEPKASLLLTSSCVVSPIRTESNKKKKCFIFDITWSADDETDEAETPAKSDGMGSPRNKDSRKKLPQQKGGSKKDIFAQAGTPPVKEEVKKASGVKGAAMAIASFWSGSNNSNDQIDNVKDRQLVLSCDEYREAERWVQAIESQIRELSDNILGIPFLAPNIRSNASRKSTPPPEVHLEDIEEWASSNKWKVFGVKDGTRVFELPPSARDNSSNTFQYSNNYSTDATLPPQYGSVPCMRVNVGMNGSVTDVFMAIMNLPPSCRTGIARSLRVIQSINNNTDIIHLSFDPVYLEPTWTAPRDFCLVRYWKQNADGSYVVCLYSTTHPDCELCTGFIRGEMQAAYIISPPKEDDCDEEQQESLLTFITLCDPKGWLWSNFGFKHKFVMELMMHVLDIRDAVDAERFVQVQFDPVAEHHITSPVPTEENSVGGLGLIPTPTLPRHMWNDVDASTFKVRGGTYMTDKVKVSSAPNLFKLVAVDVIEVPEPTRNIAAHPKNRVALAKARGENFWCFVVNIMVPGNPQVCFVMYYEGNKALLEEDTPFGRVARNFFFGNDDDYRNNRFKLIPKVVDGNMIIKMAVKDTPTLLGNKLKQYYFKEDHYFELDVDVGSSSVAKNVVGLAIGYSKAIVVDMGLCLQGNEENELPEILMGGCSCIHVDMGLAKKL